MIGKATLLEAIAGKNRGLLATETDKLAILAAIAQLEDRNPTPQPTSRGDLLEGNWRLLYTSSAEILRIGQLPLFELGQIYQCIRVQDAKLYNIAEVQGLPYLEGIVSVGARFSPVNDRRVEVKFERSILGLQRLLGYDSPESLIAKIENGQKFLPLDFSIESREQQGWLDITYLDDNLRIGRGNQGNVFVLTKVPQPISN